MSALLEVEELQVTFGGRIDDVVLFAITTRLSIPVVLVALAVVGLMGSGLGLVVATLGLL